MEELVVGSLADDRSHEAGFYRTELSSTLDLRAAFSKNT